MDKLDHIDSDPDSTWIMPGDDREKNRENITKTLGIEIKIVSDGYIEEEIASCDNFTIYPGMRRSESGEIDTPQISFVWEKSIKPNEFFEFFDQFIYGFEEELDGHNDLGKIDIMTDDSEISWNVTSAILPASDHFKPFVNAYYNADTENWRSMIYKLNEGGFRLFTSATDKYNDASTKIDIDLEIAEEMFNNQALLKFFQSHNSTMREADEEDLKKELLRMMEQVREYFERRNNPESAIVD